MEITSPELSILMKKIFLFLSFTLLCFFLQAQTGGSVSGTLIDGGTKEPIPLANIRVLKPDSTFVTGKASDNKGHFSIPINNGSYILHVSYIGYNDVYRNVQVTSSNANVRLGNIELSDDHILLSEAVVTAKAPEIVVRGDTMEYNADSYKVTESAVLEDLLKKMPGVEVDSEGQITVNGRVIQKIMVDGEEFFSSDPKVASKNLPAKMIDRLQVLERRTDLSQMTGFDDGEEEAVINLTVRPGMKEGLFGNAFAGYGSKQRYEANAMVNYMKDKDQYTALGGINNTNNAGFSDIASATFGGMGGRGRRGGGGGNGISTSANAGVNFSKQFSPKFKWGGNIRFGSVDNTTLSDVYTQNLLSSGNTFENESNVRNSLSRNFNFDFRMEWEPDTLTRFIFSPNASLQYNRRNETGDYITHNMENDTINHGESRYNSEGKGNNYGARLDVSRKLGSSGRVISAQLRGNVNNSDNEGTSASSTFYNGSRPDDILDQRFTNLNSGKSWRAYVSYVEPLGTNNFIQLAYNFRQNISESDRDTRSKDLSGNYTVLDSLYSKRTENNFINQEMELNFRSVREKYDYTIGFSVQPSRSTSKWAIGDHIIDDLTRSVWNYAPMAQFNYRWSRQHNLRVRYSGITDQPSLDQLSPVVDVSDPLNITYGNPDLDPSFRHNLNIRYRNSNPERSSFYGFFGNATYLTNDIVVSTMTDPSTGRKETTYENVAGNWNANGRFVTNFPLRNIKFSVFSMSFASYNHTNGFSNRETNLNRRTNLGQTLGLNYRSDIIDFSVRGNVNYNNVRNSLPGQQNQEFFNYGGGANTTIYLPYDFSIESDVTYSTNSGYADGFKQNEWLWNASVQKQIFKEKNGTIRFKIYDILQQRSNISRSVTSNYIRDTETNTLTSYFMFHLIYRFNIFKGGATQEDMGPQRGGRGGRF